MRLVRSARGERSSIKVIYPEAEHGEVGEVGQGRDVAYLVSVKIEQGEVGEVSQGRKADYLVPFKVEHPRA